MRVEGGSPNIVNGVSLQPTEVRLPSQLEESVNQFPTITRGLVPRNPALLKGIIKNAKPHNSTTHLIDRDKNEQYVVSISPNGIEVFDLQGNKRHVNAPNGFGYLAGASQSDLDALTVADHTFILNKKKVVQHSPELTPQYANGGLIHIVQGDYHTEYSIHVNGSIAAFLQTEGGPDSSPTDARKCEVGARPAVIAHLLAFGFPPPNTHPLPETTSPSLLSSISSQFAINLMDNVIYIQRHDNGNFALDVKAGSETKARSHKEITPNFSELPRRAPDGFCIKVSGSEDTNYDDYYVRFDKPWGAAQGRWKETVAGGIPYKIDPNTMPHLLVRENDGSFTFKPATWANRTVGDLETSPWPSFVNRRIDGMIFFKNRVGFFSGEAVALSRHEDFFNFFNESILTPLDTDPIDVAISYPEVSDIRYAVPFSGEMILFSASVPFRLASSGDLFTHQSVSIEPVLSNKSSSLVRPVVAGDRLYFINDVPSGCFVHEFVYDQDAGIKSAPTITDHVQGYIPSGITLLEGDEDLKVLAMVSERAPNEIYVYKWLWIGQEKAQAAWQKWVLNDPITQMKFFGEELVIVTSKETSQEILSINCHESWTDNKPFVILLDRRVELSGSYDVNTDRTTFTLPYRSSDAIIIQSDSINYGYQPKGIKREGNIVSVDGNISGPVYAGIPYESYGVLSKLHHRTTNNQGAYGNAIAGVNLTVANIVLETGTSAFLNVELQRDYRKPFTYEFSAALTGTKTGLFGKTILGKIEKPISVMAKSSDFRLKFGNKGPYPYTILSYRWTGEATYTSY